MLSSVGHDLRTPLAALRAAVEALADGVAPDPDRYLRAMARDIEALSSLVDDLFLLASIESQRLELPHESLDLAELADEAARHRRPGRLPAARRLILSPIGGSAPFRARLRTPTPPCAPIRRQPDRGVPQHRVPQERQESADTDSPRGCSPARSLATALGSALEQHQPD